MGGFATVQNLIPYSQQFDNAAYTKINCTVTPDAIAAPDGTLTADAILANSLILNDKYVTPGNDPVGLGALETFSVYAKAGAKSFICLLSDGTFGQIFFTLTGAGSVNNISYGGNSAFGTIVSVGDGWYRCSITVTRVHTAGSLRIYASGTASVTSYAAADTTTPQVYIWGAQAVQANWPGPYCATGAATVNNGNIRNIVATVQNLLKYSEQFDNAFWTKQAGAVVTADQAANPFGTANDADLLDITAAAADVGIYQQVFTTVGATYTFSCWIRTVAGTGNIKLADGNGGPSTVFAATTTWQRFSITFNAGNASILAQIRKAASSVANTVYIWGAQVVQANWAGPYQQTTSAPVNTGNIRNVA